VIFLDIKLKEIYTEEGNDLTKLIQEWIDENYYFLYNMNSHIYGGKNA